MERERKENVFKEGVARENECVRSKDMRESVKESDRERERERETEAETDRQRERLRVYLIFKGEIE